MTRAAMDVTNRHGMVVVTMDPDTARDLIEAWSYVHANSAQAEHRRPGWFEELVALSAAAARADMENGRRKVLTGEYTVTVVDS